MSETNNQNTVQKITPELVRQVADKVYALWLRDLAVENERRPRPAGRAATYRKRP